VTLSPLWLHDGEGDTAWCLHGAAKAASCRRGPKANRLPTQFLFLNVSDPSGSLRLMKMFQARHFFVAWNSPVWFNSPVHNSNPPH
jgi:hypothetical protein